MLQSAKPSRPRVLLAGGAIQKRLALGVLTALAAWQLCASAASAQTDTPATQNAVRHPKSPLEARVRMLTKALELDAKQQDALRTLLRTQRELVMKVWNDESVPAPYRVTATQALADRVADQIRALLSDEQKKKYNPPKPPHEALDTLDRPDIESLMYPKKNQQ